MHNTDTDTDTDTETDTDTDTDTDTLAHTPGQVCDSSAWHLLPRCPRPLTCRQASRVAPAKDDARVVWGPDQAPSSGNWERDDVRAPCWGPHAPDALDRRCP